MRKQTALSLLKNGREFLSDETRWTTGAHFRNARGAAWCPHDQAKSCCAQGAIYRASGDKITTSVVDAETCLDHAAAELFGSPDIVTLNDSTTARDKANYMNVLFAYERAIELARDANTLEDMST